MREIIFKGFHEDKNGAEKIQIDGAVKFGSWIQGKSIINAISPFDECNYVFIGGRGHMFTAVFEDEARTVISGIKGATISKVIPETVCEYTGLTDKNGKQIFEGDRIVAHEEDGDCEYSIRYKASQDYPAFDCGPCIDCDSNGLSYLFGAGIDIEVIGTIFDVKEEEK